MGMAVVEMELPVGQRVGSQLAMVEATVRVGGSQVLALFTEAQVLVALERARAIANAPEVG